MDSGILSYWCGAVGNHGSFSNVGLGGVTDERVEGGFIVRVEEFEAEVFAFDVDGPEVHGEDPWCDRGGWENGESGGAEEAAVS